MVSLGGREPGAQGLGFGGGFGSGGYGGGGGLFFMLLAASGLSLRNFKASWAASKTGAFEAALPVTLQRWGLQGLKAQKKYPESPTPLN